MINQKYITKVQKGNIPVGDIGINRTVEGDEGIVLYFGLYEKPEYEEYQKDEIAVYDENAVYKVVEAECEECNRPYVVIQDRYGNGVEYHCSCGAVQHKQHNIIQSKEINASMLLL